MSRRLPGSILLVLLVLGLLYTRSAWAESNAIFDDDDTQLTVRVSPLQLLVQNVVTIKVGDLVCDVLDNGELSNACTNLPPGEYEVRAEVEGYFSVPESYQFAVPETAAAANVPESPSAASEFYFRFYQINNELFMPSLQAMP